MTTTTFCAIPQRDIQASNSLEFGAISSGSHMEKVISVTAAPNGHVLVTLAGDHTGLFDVKPYMNSSFFEALKKPEYFNQVRLVFRGIGWPDGQDIGPDTIAADSLLLNKLPESP